MAISIVKENDSFIGGLFHMNDKSMANWKNHGRIELNHMDIAILGLLAALLTIIVALVIVRIGLCVKRRLCKPSPSSVRKSNGKEGPKSDDRLSANKLANLKYFVSSEYNQFHNKM